MSKHFLEPAAEEFAQATANPPFLYELGPAGARDALDEVQRAPIAKPAAVLRSGTPTIRKTNSPETPTER